MPNGDENYPRAFVTEIKGQLVLVDPDAFAVITAINKSNCQLTFDASLDRVTHFKGRMKELNKNPKEWVIIILSVDDKNGKVLADLLMPNHNWQEIRDNGEKPFARGLIERDFIQEAVDSIDEEASKKT